MRKNKKKEKLSDFIFMNTWQYKKTSKAFIERLCDELLQFYADHSRLTFEEFFEEKGIAEQTYYQWLKEYPTLNEINSHIKTILAGRREKGMLTGVLREKSTMYIQHQFSDRWKEADKYWSELQKKDENKENNITVIIPPLKKESNEI